MVRRALLILFALTTAGGSASVWAAGNDIKLRSDLSKDDFHSVSRELGIALSYFPLAPAAPLGFLSFDLGVEATVVPISDKSSFWQKAVRDGSPPSALVVPKLHGQVGLPFGIDVGAIYSTIPNTNLSLVGGELKWALFQGGVILPAVAIRGSYTRSLGGSEIDLETYGADVSVSKRILILTPYAGVGETWIKSSTHSSSLPSQFSETQNVTKAFVGLKLHLPLISLVGEADFSTVTAYSVRANFSF